MNRRITIFLLALLVVVSAIGYETVERPVTLAAERQKMNITLKDQGMQLDEVVGQAFGLNNIPVKFANRIEVYKGVVPVGFGTDAIGGVVNIVTNKHHKGWFADASYSYGSFNTHKSHIHFGQTLGHGFTYEVNAFQNYSDNDYHVDSPVCLLAQLC